MRSLLLASSLVLLPVFALAQRPPAPDLPQQRQHMAEVQFLVGTWKGEAWMEMQPGQRQTFASSEVVESRLDGLVLIVEGLHTEGDRVVHHALGILSWDEAAGNYSFRTKLAEGHGTDATGRLEDGKFVWSPGTTPVGQVRYTIGLDAEGRWQESGEMSRDGKTWKPFFGMTLERVDAKP
jgi:hypothetical protein